MEKNLKSKKPEVRFLYNLKEVLYDQKWLKGTNDFPVYYMYRSIKKKDGLRYDITVIPPRMLGKEFVRTKGNRNCKLFQELYTVLSGEAIFLMQEAKGEIVKDVLVVKAKKGDWAIVPPKYAVVMINPYKDTLKTGNWVSEENKNIYEELEKMGGACYYYTKSGWIKNRNYKKIPKLRVEKPLKKLPGNLNFLYG